MNGYFKQNAGQGNDRMSKGILNISVTNIKEFKTLIDKAKEEACQLNETIDKLHSFQLHIEFSTKDAI
ncbi:MAG: hypothetical protein HFG29_01245 [Eubacterium sp.]|nr:hypothetical protein [Eubacterium sp.]